MSPVPDLLVSGVLVGLGAVLALAGRAVYEAVVKLVGFSVGFGAVAFGGAAAQFFVGESGAGLFSPQVLVVALVAGLVTMSLAWLAYVLAVVAPGFLGGSMLGMTLVAPPNGGEWLVVLLLGAAGAALAWYLHQLFLVVVTAVAGGVLVALGATSHSVTDLPFVDRPWLLVEDPGLAFDAAVGLFQSMLAVVAVVAVVGVAVQVGLTPAGAE